MSGVPGEHASAGGRGREVDDAHWLAYAVELATRNIDEGGGPFGAVIVRDDAIVATGQNRVTRDNDPTAHAEVVAIRAAGRQLGDFNLAGTALFSSCEPCPLCLSAALWARVDRVVFAADRSDAARAGFDDSAFYELWAQNRSEWTVPLVAVNRVDGAERPFDAWLRNTARVEY